jgi:hypothetical protein
MSHRHHRRSILLAGTMILLLAGSASAQGGFAGPIFGLDTSPNGATLVADTGAGIVVVKGDRQSVVDLPGATDVSAVGNQMWWVTRTGEDPEHDSGQGLYRVTGGNAELVANLFEVEATDPDGRGVDSNPFDVQALGGGAALVVDSGGNDLLRVNRRGNVEVLAIFPDDLLRTANFKSLVGCPASGDEFCGAPDAIPGQPVPTSVAVGPDGYYYVGELKGFPAPTNQSRVWRISPNASRAMCGSSPDCQLVFDGGFTSIIDLAFGPDGALYVAELDEASWAAVEILQQPTGGTVNRCDLGTLVCTEVATDLNILTAITFAKDGTLLAAVDALVPGLAGIVEVPR